MLGNRACLCLWVCLAFVGPCSTNGPGNERLPNEAELDRYGLVRAWSNRAVFNPARDTIRSISADEQAVFVQSTGGTITAFDSETGRMMWSKLIGTPDQINYPLATNDTTAFMAGGMHLFAIDKASGETLWQVRLPDHPSAPPEVDDRQIYVGTADGSVYALDLAKTKDLYSRRLLPAYSEATYRWRYQAPSEIVTPPVSNGEAVVFASYSGLLFSVAVQNRGLNFQFETEGRAPIRVPFGRSDDIVFVASDDARVFALDILSGVRKWSFTAGEAPRQQPRVVGRHVYVIPFGRGMYALRTQTGFQQWHQREADSFLAATTNYIIASNNLGSVLILDRDSGANLGTLPYRSFSQRVHNERTDRLYMATESGLVVCIREKGRDKPVWHKYPERQPIPAELAPDEPAADAPAADSAPAENPAPVDPAAM
ncbi:MAG: PQQ-binding-like beta-propeller repeat protein [Planctomycetaceae bacterium]